MKVVSARYHQIDRYTKALPASLSDCKIAGISMKRCAPSVRTRLMDYVNLHDSSLSMVLVSDVAMMYIVYKWLKNETI